MLEITTWSCVCVCVGGSFDLEFKACVCFL